MIYKAFNDVTFADIQVLIDNAVQESRTLDYKRELPTNADTPKKDFLADVASFANAAGGDIIFGLADKKDAEGKNTGSPEFLGLADDTNSDTEIQRLQNMIREGISPRIQPIQIKFIENTEKKKLAFLRIPKSWSAPHMVTFNTKPAFYSRSSAGKQPLDVNEIRNAFFRWRTVGKENSKFSR